MELELRGPQAYPITLEETEAGGDTVWTRHRGKVWSPRAMHISGPVDGQVKRLHLSTADKVHVALWLSNIQS